MRRVLSYPLAQPSDQAMRAKFENLQKLKFGKFKFWLKFSIFVFLNLFIK